MKMCPLASQGPGCLEQINPAQWVGATKPQSMTQIRHYYSVVLYTSSIAPNCCVDSKESADAIVMCVAAQLDGVF